MIIGIDAVSFGESLESGRTGLFIYGTSLMSELLKADRHNKYLFYSMDKITVLNRLGVFSKADNRVITKRMLWHQNGLSKELAKDKADIFLGLNQSVPLFAKVKKIIVVHDIGFLKHPAYYPKGKFRLGLITILGILGADRIIAVSEATGNDLTEILRINRNKITVIPHGLGEDIRKAKRSIIKRKPYFLYVGAVKKVKNIENIIRAYRLYRKNKGSAAKGLKIAGPILNSEPDAASLLKKAVDEGIVEYLGYVDRNQLLDLYANAYCFISPSLYEGFCLPVLEAMGSGLPVITSRRGAIPEVAGDFALYADPQSPHNISKKMEAIDEASSILRDKLSKLALKRAEKFSWKKSAGQLFEVIKKYE